MTNSKNTTKDAKKSKDLCIELKALILSGEIQLEDILDVLYEKDCHKVAIKAKDKHVLEFETIHEEDEAPVPSSGAIDLSDDEQSRSEPFSDSDNEIADVLNRGINESDLDDSHKLNFSTDKSVVTKENQHIERRIDPFNDKDKIIGAKISNPQSRAPITMRQADPLEKFPQEMIDCMNETTYDEKSKWRKASLLKEGLTKEKMEPKVAKIEDLELREKLRIEKEREEIDASRRIQKTVEPNAINTANGEWSDIWREWYDRRLSQIEAWLLEDATIYRHLPPSKECNPPRNVKTSTATDWNVFRKSEIQVPWDFEKYGPMMLTDEMAYDGSKLYDPINGRPWSNVIEYLETQVKRKFESEYPGAGFEVFDKNDGFFWSTILQQWYDEINVSLH